MIESTDSDIVSDIPLDLGEGGHERYLLKKVTYTSDMAFLNGYVYSSDPIRSRATIANPRLTEEHCRYLLPKLDGDTMLRALLVEHESFPADLLESLAMSEEEPLVRGIIAFHSNTSSNAKNIAALKGTLSFEDWIGISSGRRQPR